MHPTDLPAIDIAMPPGAISAVAICVVAKVAELTDGTLQPLRTLLFCHHSSTATRNSKPYIPHPLQALGRRRSDGALAARAPGCRALLP
jgi:hypothetical protein